MTQPPLWIRIFFGAFPFISLFFFPWTLTLVASFASGLVFPPLPVVIGILVDLLYHPGSGMRFIGTISGVIITALAFFVRYIIRTRIM